jgi:geranyl-CoA carboxylase alpha subunit
VLRNILIANRGEIALRIMRTARALGYRTTAIYSEADASAPHVAFADSAVLVGSAEVAASYLNVAAILEAARLTSADAVHPGYGLLAENAAFARACQGAGLVFVGPRPETIELMGDKRRARIAMQAAGVACVPGYDGEDQSDAALVREAARIGFPVMVKAAAGGGGRGMRRVEAQADLLEALSRARSEAEHAFGDGRLVLERALDGARHVEVQIFADAHGHVLSLGERDCSMQRRFQKLIEEAPSPAVDAALRTRMSEVAVLAAKSSGYLGAGTVELLLEPAGSFYFLEMNTRIQVEHPVTEMVTGIDLVAWQLRIAEGEPLLLSQAEVRSTGHAIEARLYAEDPARDFMPATGQVLALRLPEGTGLRVDHALCAGLAISPHYDPMLAKVIAYGADREQARLRLCAALERLCVLGVQTNQDFLRALLEHPRFLAGEATTDFLDKGFDIASATTSVPSTEFFIAAALVLSAHAATERPYPTELASFTNCVELGWRVVLESGEARKELSIEPADRDHGLGVRIGGEHVPVALGEHTSATLTLVISGVRKRFDYAWDGERLWLRTPEGTRAFRDLTYASEQGSDAQGSGRAVAPMDGAVVDLAVRVGERVMRGQTLAVIAAMKLELRVAADVDGVVRAVHAKRGDQVKARQLLVELEAPAGSKALDAARPS